MRMTYSVIGTGDSALMFATDLSTGQSIQVPRWAALDESRREKIMDTLTAAQGADYDGDPIGEIRETITDGDNDSIMKMRAELGVTVNSDDTMTIAGIVFPERMSQILATVNTVEEGRSVIRFAERLASNPFPHVRDALIEWILLNPDLSLSTDGEVIGYRGLTDNFMSKNRGYGIVNGVEITNGALDNTPGNVLEYPRGMVDMNPDVYCSVGLHVGTWKYADGYADTHRVSVAFGPEEVVSPPTDAAQEKIRVCKMRILEEITRPYSGGIIDTNTITPNTINTEEN